MELILGVDIGGTYTKYGAIDNEGDLLFQGRISSRIADNFEDFTVAFAEEIEKRLNSFSCHLKGIGVGSPMGSPLTGKITGACNLEDIWGDDVPLVSSFEQEFKVPAFLMNDSNAAAVGEKYYGHAKPYQDFLVLTLGTGLGCGIYSNGSLLIGRSGSAGEVGHTTVVPGGRDCNCGRKGCLETYVSATGLVRTAQELLISERFTDAKTNIQDAVSISEAALQGDLLAQETFRVTGAHLGNALANLAAIFDPEAIVLAGGLSNSGDLLLDPVRETFEAQVLQSLKGSVDLWVSDSKFKNKAVLGAASYAREKLRSPELQIVEEL